MKNRLSIFILLLSSLVISSCSNIDNNREPLENEIKDASGVIIKIPDDPLTATVASVYAVSTPFFLALNITDRVLAINTKKPFIKSNDEGLNRAGSIGNGVVDLEKLAKYNPTVLVHRSNDPKTVKKVNKLGIDVITITVENMDDVKFTLMNLGKYFGVSDRAVEVCNYIDNEFKYIDEIVNKIPLSDRVSALVMGGELGRIAGNDMLQTWMIEKAGGIPVVDQGTNHNWINVGVEKIFEYNPEYLFLTSSTAREYSTDQLYSSSAWNACKCVINEDIYVIPSNNDSWDMPGLSPVLGTLYMLKTMYPNYLTIDEFKTHIDTYYNLMFGRTFTEDELGYSLI